FLQSSEKGVVTNVNLSTAIRVVGNDVVESQFVQDEIDLVKVYLVVSEGASKNLISKKLEYELRFRFGNNTKFDFKFVDKIPTTSGGKKRFAINNIK
ncbi:phenylacetate--CoA ligase family protein, partial [Staphylococcus equorum]